MKGVILVFAIIAAADVRDHKVSKYKARAQNARDHVARDHVVHDHAAHDHVARDHDGRTGTYGDYCYSNSDCASNYFCDMYPGNPWCEYCQG